MQFHLSALCFFLLSLTSWAEGDELCGTNHKKQPEPKSEPTKLVLVQSESIELSTTDITNLLFGKKLEQPGSKIRADIQKLIDVKKAKVIRNTSIIIRANKTATHNAGLSTIFPTDYSSGYTLAERINSKGEIVTKAAQVAPTPTNYEERLVGNSLKADFLPLNGKRILLNYEAIINKRLPNCIYRTDKVGDITHKVFTPSFYEFSLKNSIQIHHLKTQLVAVHSVFDEQGKALSDRKIVHLVKTTILSL